MTPLPDETPEAAPTAAEREVCWVNEDCIAGHHMDEIECRFPSWTDDAAEPDAGDMEALAIDARLTRHAIADVVRAHVFLSSRVWPDGREPVAPDWNPGCTCGASHYYFEHDLHVADALLAARVLSPDGADPMSAPEVVLTSEEHDHSLPCFRCGAKFRECCPHCPATISRADVKQARREARAFGDADE